VASSGTQLFILEIFTANRRNISGSNFFRKSFILLQVTSVKFIMKKITAFMRLHF